MDDERRCPICDIEEDERDMVLVCGECSGRMMTLRDRHTVLAARVKELEACNKGLRTISRLERVRRGTGYLSADQLKEMLDAIAVTKA